jgi:hypothetical protein
MNNRSEDEKPNYQRVGTGYTVTIKKEETFLHQQHLPEFE